MHFYTSINNNYLAKARVLAKSVKQYCEDARFTLVLADNILGEINLDKEPFDEIVTVDELNIPVDNLQQWIYIHSVVELCTAIKGQALVKFLEEGSEKVVYLDPDIAVFDSLKSLENILDEYDVVLTPHQTIKERTKQNIEDNEICSLKHGVFNYGFYAVKNSENGLEYAKWWRDRLLAYCFDDIPNGLFTDQRWGDLAPALFDFIFIWRDPGCNVSTWNITTRIMSKSNEKYFVNGEPLKFYHFSGFDSGAQKIMLKKNGGDNSCLIELRNWYLQRQIEEGQEKLYKIPSIYNFYDNGEVIPKEHRILMRNRVDLMSYFADIDPAKTKQKKSYYSWVKLEMKFNKSKILGRISNNASKVIQYFHVCVNSKKNNR